MNGITDTFDTVQENIGFTVNYEKTTVYTLNSCDSVKIDRTFNWTDVPPTLLGVWLNSGADQLYPLLDRAQATLKQWKNRNLTLMGRVLVVNTLIASLYVYIMQCVCNPDPNFFMKYDALIHAYLWGGQRALAKVPRKLLQLPKALAGLNLVNIRAKCKSLKIPWVVKDNMYVRMLLLNLIPRELGMTFFYCNLSPVHVKEFLKNYTPLFWQEVISEFFELQILLGKRKSTQNSNKICFSKTFLM